MCDVLRDPATGKPIGVICGGHRRGRQKKCWRCGQPADVECDSCDAALCSRGCRIHVPPNKDYCAHNTKCRAAAKDAAAQLRLFEGAGL